MMSPLAGSSIADSKTRKSPKPETDSASQTLRETWLAAFRKVRVETERRASFLSPEDQVIQSMPDASPAKWHRADTTWFFEQFLLVPHVPGYKIFDERFAYLFNSYYVSAGPRHARTQRGLITRPGASEVARFRAHVDAAVERLIEGAGAVELRKLIPIVEIGLNHEQQHQELLITDILHAFAQNPTDPGYDSGWRVPRATQAPRIIGPRSFVDVPSGIMTIGHEGEGFCFDNEPPRHDELIPNVRIARHLVSNAEWLE